MIDNDEFLEYVSELNPEAAYPTDMEEAIIGIVERAGTNPLILLDKEKCLEILIKDGMDQDSAIEFFDFNVLGSWVGDGTPCFATLKEAM